ncbi:hypothetical protein [Sphingomonas panacis]|nr:hypothetical protein [Sphingomonas panacis]
MFLDCHHRLGCLVSEMLPFGTTLYCALLYLDRVEVTFVVDDLQTLPRSGLSGDRDCFVGAPASLADVLTRIADRVEAVPARPKLAALGTRICVVALKRFRLAPVNLVLEAYDQLLSDAGDNLKIAKGGRGQRDIFKPGQEDR